MVADAVGWILDLPLLLLTGSSHELVFDLQHHHMSCVVSLSSLPFRSTAWFLVPGSWLLAPTHTRHLSISFLFLDLLHDTTLYIAVASVA